ncbi:MAG: T9SS type A sorting domain-containing protein [Bacteroidetes bacterium]|nr:T9SS type A sorting domain-containing protein [Bacteroidota bacterium]
MKKYLLIAGIVFFSKTVFSQCYSVSQINYAPDSFNLGTQITIADDQWSSVISLPFFFCFMGAQDSAVVMGSNGILSFNISLANQYCQWPIGAAVPNPADPENCIFFPWQDLYLDSTQHFYYNTYGTSPNRRFVASIYRAPMYASTGLKFTGEVILYETTNIIEIQIQHKSLFTGWNGGMAIEGIQNSTGTTGLVVPGRNYPTQWTANNDAWRFTPTCNVCSGVGINALTDEFHFNIYPSPASSEIHIDYSGNARSFSCEISDQLGRVIKKDLMSADNERVISLEGIASGIYLIRIIGEKGEILETKKQIIE